MERTELTLSERIQRGAVIGGATGLTAATVGLAYGIMNNPEFAKNFIQYKNDILETIGILVSLNTILWAGIGGVMNGFINPKLDQLQNWLDNQK